MTRIEAKDVEKIVMRADSIFSAATYALELASPIDLDASDSIGRIVSTMDEVPPDLWLNLAALDVALEGTPTKVLENLIGMVAAGLWSFASATEMLGTFRPDYREAPGADHELRP